VLWPVIPHHRTILPPTGCIVPILFIRGKNDPSIGWEDFERAWNSVKAPKTAFIVKKLCRKKG
jgi:hypothetical protein